MSNYRHVNLNHLEKKKFHDVNTIVFKLDLRTYWATQLKTDKLISCVTAFSESFLLMLNKNNNRLSAVIIKYLLSQNKLRLSEVIAL